MDISILAEQFYDYSLHIRGYSKDTIRRYRYVVNSFIKQSGVQTIGEVSVANVRALFYIGRAKRRWSANTYLVFYKSLLVFFRWCIQQGFMSSNPVDGIETPKLEKRLPASLNKQAAFRLLEIVDNYPYEHTFLRHRDNAIIAMFMYTGIRKSELLHLKFTDVDITNLILYVRQGKGNKDRIVPISFTLAQILKRYLIERKNQQKTCPEFFTSLKCNVGVPNIALRRLVEKLRLTSGINFSVHKLRHTFATLMIEGGCDIYNLSRMMGHSDIKTTTIYLSASAEHLRSQMTKHPLNTTIC